MSSDLLIKENAEHDNKPLSVRMARPTFVAAKRKTPFGGVRSEAVCYGRMQWISCAGEIIVKKKRRVDNVSACIQNQSGSLMWFALKIIIRWKIIFY